MLLPIADAGAWQSAVLLGTGLCLKDFAAATAGMTLELETACVIELQPA